MLSDALPIYSGGLGNVAGDQLKSGSDLGVPVIGVGLLYQQRLLPAAASMRRADSRRSIHSTIPASFRSRPCACRTANWLSVMVDLPGFQLRVRTWQVQVGRTKLYLLDTNDPANLPVYRGITSELYGGDSVIRLQQERVLGVGGWRLLRALGINPEVCHLNEGHAAFAVLERARSYMEDHRVPFDVALTVTRAGNVFTSHTPVEAGFDRFPPDLMKSQFTQYAEAELGISMPQLLALGRADPSDDNEPFNMAYLAIRTSTAINGVSRLHGEVSRRIFQNLFPRWPVPEVPVGHVTNGVHVPTWDSVEADDLWTKACGKSRWYGDLKALEEGLRRVPGTDLWTMRTKARTGLIEYARQRLARQLAGHGAPPDETSRAEKIFDPDSMTMGFARRFATYKRPNLLLHDPDRLLRILLNKQRPVQLIIAGKAHPQDMDGQEMIRQWIQFIRETPARSQAVFLADYDMTHGRTPGAGRRSLAEHSAAALGGERNEWNESAGERGIEFFRTGWLVGRGMDAQRRLGTR